MHRRLLLLAGLPVVLVAGVVVADVGQDSAQRYRTAAAVTAALREELPCAQQPLGGKYAGVEHDRCLLDSEPVDVWLGGGGPVTEQELTGDGWRVVAEPATLRRVRDAVGGQLRDTPISVTYSVRGTVPPACLDLPGTGVPVPEPGGERAWVLFKGDAREQARARACLDVPGAELTFTDTFRTNAGQGRVGRAMQHG